MFIKVKVFHGSKKSTVLKKSVDSFDVHVKAKPVFGAATREARDALAEHFKIPVFKIRLTKGAKKQNKIFEIDKNAIK